jgi:hypothetical protein
MISPADVPELHGSHLKSWRAYEHACTLQASIERWKYAGGYKFNRTVDDDGWHHVTMRFNALPSEWSLLIGECVQNLRNSLDNLLFALATLEAGRPLTADEQKVMEFPICERPDQLSKRRQAMLTMLPTPVADFVVKIQPFSTPVDGKAAHAALALLHRLSVLDKHRAIPTHLVSLDSLMTTCMVREVKSIVLPNSPISDGLELSVFLPGEDVELGQTSGIAADFDVVFGDEVPSLEGREVVLVLKSLREYVQKVHNQCLSMAGYDAQTPWNLALEPED